MGDIFIERMVKKKMEGKDFAIIFGIFAAAVVLMFVGVILMGITGIPMIPMLVLCGVCYGGYKLISMQNLEYEYSFTNGYLTVDKIMNRSSRKRMAAFECKEIEEIGEYTKNASRLQNRQVEAKVYATVYQDRRDAWYVIVRTKKTGKTLILFNPDEDILNAVKKCIPAHLRFEVFGRN